MVFLKIERGHPFNPKRIRLSLFSSEVYTLSYEDSSELHCVFSAHHFRFIARTHELMHNYTRYRVCSIENFIHELSSIRKRTSEFSHTTQRIVQSISMVQFVCFIDTEIVEKPIFVNLTRVFRELIQLRCMRVKLELKHQFLF